MVVCELCGRGGHFTESNWFLQQKPCSKFQLAYLIAVVSRFVGEIWLLLFVLKFYEFMRIHFVCCLTVHVGLQRWEIWLIARFAEETIHPELCDHVWPGPSVMELFPAILSACLAEAQKRTCLFHSASHSVFPWSQWEPKLKQSAQLLADKTDALQQCGFLCQVVGMPSVLGMAQMINTVGSEYDSAVIGRIWSVQHSGDTDLVLSSLALFQENRFPMIKMRAAQTSTTGRSCFCNQRVKCLHLIKSTASKSSWTVDSWHITPMYYFDFLQIKRISPPLHAPKRFGTQQSHWNVDARFSPGEELQYQHSISRTRKNITMLSCKQTMFLWCSSAHNVLLFATCINQPHSVGCTFCDTVLSSSDACFTVVNCEGGDSDSPNCASCTTQTVSGRVLSVLQHHNMCPKDCRQEMLVFGK